MLNHTLHAALHRNLAVALHTALAKAPRHRQRLSAEGYRITSFRERPMQIRERTLRGGRNIHAVTGGNTLRFHCDGTNPRNKIGKSIRIRHDKFDHLGIGKAFKNLMKTINTANKPVVRTTPETTPKFRVITP